MAYEQQAYNGHQFDCDCGPCMEADLNAAIRANGLNPVDYAAQEFKAKGERTRYAKPGARSGNGRVRYASEAQIRFIRRLMAERDTSALVRLPGSEDIDNISLKGATDLIDRLMGCPELPQANLATEPQKRFIRSLVADRVASDEAKRLWKDEVIDTLTRQMATDVISRLKSKPRLNQENKAADAPVEPGVYRTEGTLYRVVRGKSGRNYAEELDEQTGAASYAKGAIFRIRADHRVTLEEAKRFGRQTGRCSECLRELTNPQSIEDGIGPICAKQYA